MGAESTPGVPAERMVPVIDSEISISWVATFEPFREELPAACDWVDWVASEDPKAEGRRLYRDWVHRDERNEALRKAIPEDFVRSRIVQSANRDLVLALGSGCAASQDNLHANVVSRRFEDSHAEWRLTGYALPIVVPSVAGLGWEDIARLRREKGLQQLRGILQEVEGETADVAVRGGDLERAVHHAVEKRLTIAGGKVDSLLGTAKRTALGLVIGVGTGVATVGLTGPVAIGAEAAMGAAAGGVLDAREVIRNRNSRRWIGVLNRLRETSG
jgi:hypothetical protein